MGNSEDDYYKWLNVEVAARSFEDCRGTIRTMHCPVHHRKAFIDWEYFSDYTTHAWVRKYCCHPFATQVLEVLKKAEAFDKIDIVEHQ